ncbi:transmembrane protein 276 [Erythrolamprus reginae]|uniref:transmembrane protein 276 n=1 Tax=Erythrolamprus reginae TaxID=121349 RepID=UPI00396D0418
MRGARRTLGLAEEANRAVGSIPMPSWPEQDLATFLANLLLPAVCLYSAVRTFQINRGAAAGFFLQALGPLLETLPFGSSWQGAQPPDHTWPCTVVGLPLLAFGFHWLNGDCFTANVLLGGALMLAGGWGYFTEEGKAVVVHSVISVVTITIFIVSIFTGSAYGVMGSLLLAMASLLPGTGLWPLWAPKESDAVRCLTAAAHLALCRALQAQHLELGNSYREWLPVVAS